MKIRVIRLERDRFTLYPLSDVHFPRHKEDKLKEWRDVVQSDKEGLVTLGGDMFDLARGTCRAYLKGYQADSNSLLPIDDMTKAHVEQFAEFLKPIADKIIMICCGNHHWTLANGRVSDQELAIALGVKDAWVGHQGIASVRMANGTKVQICLHHNAGRGGRTIGSDVLAFQHASHDHEADIYVLGHTHKQYAGIFQTKLTVNRKDKIGARHLVYVRSGAFMENYAESVTNAEDPYIPDYAEMAMLSPSVMGIVSLQVISKTKDDLDYETRQRTL